MSELKRTPLFEAQRQAGGRLVPFAGWEMAVSFSGILEEHRAVRSAAGIFDVSHMGRYRMEGARAAEALDGLFTGRASALTEGHWLYTLMLNEQGGVLEDLLVGRQPDHWLIVVNAANREADFARIAQAAARAGAELYDDSDKFALIALQGPQSRGMLERVVNVNLQGLAYYWMRRVVWKGLELIVSRTGYTGELGYEVYVPSGAAVTLWRELVKAGAVPCGLGARDTLRLEVGYPLYGHELGTDHTPLEAGLGWAVDLDKPSFCGREALLRQKKEGLKVRLRGFTASEKDIPRQGYELLHEGRTVATVLSGGPAPSLGYGVGTAYLPAVLAEPGSELMLSLRGKREAKVTVAKIPFYKNGTAKA
ncbi:glycine cleavage system aminomethyltransferase GcvT [bacterium]|nr:glycine cleavage system aminomethyltransferase GcvT [bacterium]